MRLCLLIEGFNCAGRGRSFGHCAGIASAARMGFAWRRRVRRSMRLGGERLGRGKSVAQVEPQLDSATDCSVREWATGNLIELYP